jgi:mRNA-degrading endonuclease YafQ of YafQ-DinJ toxin-antitoxin module
MRTIRRTTQFKRDYKRTRAGRHRATLDDDLLAVVRLLATDTPLPARHRDHPLIGDWKTTGTATSDLTSSSSTGNQMPPRWNWCAWVLIVNWASTPTQTTAGLCQKSRVSGHTTPSRDT